MRRHRDIRAPLLGLLLTATLFTVPAQAATYSDVPADAWYMEAVSQASELGLMMGTSDLTFSPDLPLSRAMLATTLYRLAGSPTASGSLSFSDTEEESWYGDAVRWAAQYGYMEGYGDGRFAPDEPVTREQFVTVLWRYAGIPVGTGSLDFADGAAISGWAGAAVSWARGIGLVEGEPDGSFAPAGETTRAQAAAILTRYLDQLQTEEPEPSPPAEEPSAPETGAPEPSQEPEAPEAGETPETAAPPESETPAEPSPPESEPPETEVPEPPASVPPEESGPETGDETPSIPLNQYDSELFTVVDGFLHYLGTPVSRVGVDVSSHQGEIDWQRVAGAGVEFAIIRVGYRGYTVGGINQDPYFHQNIQGALDAGLEVGVYFYSQAVTVEEAVEEAVQTLEWIQGYDVTYPVVFDWERVSGASSRTDSTTGETITACARAFCEIVEAAGYQPMVYGNTSNISEGDLDLAQLLDYPFWLAHYTPDWTPTDFPCHYHMWQYSSRGSVDGIEGRVDLDLCLTDW